jgi:predicted RND superfamily exporter protein
MDYPRLAVLLLVSITAVSLGGYLRPTWPAELRTWLTGASANIESEPESRPRSNRRRQVTQSGESLGRADAFLVVQCPQLFSVDGAAALRSVVERIDSLETVARVRSLDQAPPLNIFGLPEPILPRGQATEQRFAASKEKAIQHPLVVGQLLSPDAKTTLIEIQFDWINIREDADCTSRILEAARNAAKEHPKVSMQIDLTGPVPFRLMLIQNEQSNEVKYQVIGYGMILLMAIILFRGLSVVLVVASAPVIGVWWTLGILRYFDLQFNPFSNVILPVLLSLVGFTDGVHMMVHIRNGLRSGLAPKEACKQTLAMVGMACLLTSLTTAIGMGSLILAHHKIVREFGISCVIGVTATWISVMLIIPLVCSTRWSKRLAKGSERDFIEQHLNRLGPLITAMVKHRKTVSYVSIALLLLLGSIALTLKPDDRKSNALPSGSDEQRALAHLDQAMGGLDICEVSIQWKDEELRDEDIAAVISRVDQILRAEPLIGHPLSLCRLIEAMPGEGTAVDKISMVELLPPPLKQALYSHDNQVATVVFRCMDLGTSAYKSTFERIEAGFRNIEFESPGGISIALAGDPIRRWRDLHQIVTDLISSLGSASIVIFLVMGIVYRSVRIGLISIVPNLLPLAASATWLVITGQPLEIVGVCSFTVCLGIAVDDTIHFLSRYGDELKLTSDRGLAIERAFQGVGTGMIMTTLVLVAGFASVLTSDTRDHRIFASLGVITLVTALLCDLFLLPALLAFFDRPQRKDS